MDFLDFIRKVHEERKQRFIAKHYGPGPHPSGSPQSVHGGKGKKGGKRRAGAKARKGKMPTQTHMKRAAKVNTIADRSPSKLKDIAISSLLAARGVTEDIRTQYKGVRGTQAQRNRLDARIKTLDAELKRRGIKNPASAIRERWPGWKPMRKIKLRG